MWASETVKWSQCNASYSLMWNWSHSPIIPLTTRLESLAYTHLEWWSSGFNDIPLPPYWLPAVIIFKRPSAVKTVEQRFSKQANPVVMIIHHIPMKTQIKEGFSAVLAITRTFAARNRIVLHTSKHLQEVGIILFITGCQFKMTQPQRKRTDHKTCGWTLIIFFLTSFL